MKLTVIGTGYVGLVAGACFSEMGNSVICVDKDKKTINNLIQGVVHIYEPGLKSIINEGLSNNNLSFTTSIEDAIKISNIIFIAVGTPMDINGNADLRAVYEVAREIGINIRKKTIIVNKSTVPVGTADKVKDIISKELHIRDVNIEFDVVSNPEFLKEGSAINDFMKPDRVIIGSSSKFALQVMKKLYSPFFRTHQRYLEMDTRSAEMTKYAANAMLATKISFINEMAIICEKVNADINKVRLGIGSDKRIGYDFIYPGIGYGGTCFPKDISALQKISEKEGYQPILLSSVSKVNSYQKDFFLNKITTRFGYDLKGKTFTIWGVTFKPDTDDIREAPSIYIINKLISFGAKIKTYDPKVKKIDLFSKIENSENIKFTKSKYDALKNSQALILLTEWKEFRAPDFEEIKNTLLKPVIFDGRNQYDSFNLKDLGFEYYQIGKN